MGNERAYVYEGGVYIIRDVRDAHGDNVTCQYAITDEVHGVVWVDCVEGVSFSDIDPLCVL